MTDPSGEPPGLCRDCGQPLSPLQESRRGRFCSPGCYHAWQRTPEGRAALAAAARLGHERRAARRARGTRSTTEVTP